MVHLLGVPVDGENGRVSDKPRQLPRHQRAQAHNSTRTFLSSAQFYVLAM
jgi:hypothetical protein